MKQKTLKSFTKMMIAVLISFAKMIVTRMAAKPELFADRTPSDEEINAAIALCDQKEVEYLDAQKTTRNIKDERDSAVAVLRQLLKRRAEYVDNYANGDIQILDESGFEITKASRSHHELPMIEDLIVRSDDEKGIAHLNWSPIKYALNYTIYCTENKDDPEALRIIGTSTKSSYETKVLPSGTQMHFMVKPTNATNEGPASNYIEFVIP